MSAFMCSRELISNLSDFIYKGAITYPRLVKLHIELRNIIGHELSPEDVFQVLKQMNVNALTFTYGEEKAKKMCDLKSFDYISKEERAERSDIQTFKDYECFLYQCAEHGVAGTNLYDLLCDDLTDLAVNLIRQTSDYENATWGK